MTIPFNRPVVAGREFEFIREAVALQKLSGDGVFTERCEDWLTDAIGCRATLLAHSCTAALEMAAILADIRPGDEVIMPSFTFVSTANAVALRGGVPVFVDIRRDTLNIDETLISRAITAKTKAITAVHYAGVPAEMSVINAVAADHGLIVFEDAAQALGSTYEGKPAGSLSHLSAFSFHETKNIISGEGGALAINDPAYVERAEIIREKGTNRKRFFRGAVDKYTWEDIGSSFAPSELIAAFLYGQLEQAQAIQSDRMATWRTYLERLTSFAERGLGLPQIPSNCTHNAHLFYVLLPSHALQRELIARMKADGIMTPFHYVPLHSTTAGRTFGRADGELANTDELSEKLVRLPLYPKLGDDLDRVVGRLETHLDQLL
jgi:dTDP-4-amino-4,6-dideoxygalactose transaminase